MPWRLETLDGHKFYIMQQKGIASCGIACVAMVINRVRKSMPTERAIMQDSWALGEGGYKAAHSDRKGLQRIMNVHVHAELTATLAKRARPGTLTNLPLDEIDRWYEKVNIGKGTGTKARNMAEVLRKRWKIACEYRDFPPLRFSLKQAIESASHTTPVILLLNNPDHFVLCEGPTGVDKEVYICDPGTGNAFKAYLVDDSAAIENGGVVRQVTRMITMIKKIPPVPSRAGRPRIINV